MDERPPECRAVVNIVNKQPRTTDKGRPSSFVLCQVLTTPYRKNVKYYESSTKTSELGWSFCRTYAMRIRMGVYIIQRKIWKLY